MIKTVGASPTVSNLFLADSNTEYSLYFPSDCKKLLVKAREKSVVRLAFKKDETATNYITLPKGAIWCEDLILGPFTAFFKAEVDNIWLEILMWFSKE